MNNLLIRNTLSKTSTKQWQLAEMLGISEFTLSRKLRNELPFEEQERIISIILRHSKEGV